MTRIGILLGTTRANRVGEQVAHWVLDQATAHDDATFELIDLRDWPLPHFDEPMSPVLGDYQHEHTKAWAEQIASYDGFAEWNHKAPRAARGPSSISGSSPSVFKPAEQHARALAILLG